MVEAEMNASPVLVPEVPALPDDHQLSQQLEHRPNWVDLFTRIDGLTGQQLFEMGEFGALELEALTDMDTQVKQYRELFLEWYWRSPFGAVEKAGQEFQESIRFAEERRCKDFAEKYRLAAGEFSRLQREENERKRLAQQAEQTRIAEEDKRRQLAEAEARRATAAPEVVAEIEAEIEQVKNTPLMPATVSMAQAAVGSPKIPSKVTTTAQYEYTVTNWPLFLRWLADNPVQVTQLKIVPNWTSLKYQRETIPGVQVNPLPDKIGNRRK